MSNKRGAAILAAVSAALLAVSLGYFALTPGAWASLDIGGWASSLLQTTAEAPDSGSADSKADEKREKDASAKGDDAQKGKDAPDEKNDVPDDSTGDADAAASSADNAATSDSPTAADEAATGSPNTEDQSPAPAPANTVTVSVSVSSGAVGNPVASSGTFTFERGATAYDALCALGLSVNASNTSMGIYVAAIGGLAEKEHGATSGWMYSVNGVAPNYSAGGYVLNDGDSVSWYYVTG